MNWILTHTGKRFDLFDPDAEARLTYHKRPMDQFDIEHRRKAA